MMMMSLSCTISHSLSASSSSSLQQQQQLKPCSQMLWLSTQNRPFLLLLHGSPPLHGCRTKAIATSFIVAATSPPMSADKSVLLQTGGLLLFTYWFFNFFVTGFISKYYGIEKPDQSSGDASPSEADKPNFPPTASEATSASPKRGFGNNKTKTKT